MKDSKELQRELDVLLKTDKAEFLPKQLNAIRKKIQFLMTCRNYLDTNPRPEFIKSEITRLTKIIDTIKDGFSTYQSTHVDDGLNYGQLLTRYESETNVKHFKDQLKTLKFLVK